jgi:hypothetical protein
MVTLPRLPFLVMVWGAFLRVLKHPATRLGVVALMLVVQMVLLWLVGETVDLFVSVTELWVDLARKHLELTL